MYLCDVRLFILLCFTLNNCVPTIGILRQDLGGVWRVQNTHAGYDLPATVPGGIYTDLMNNDIIGDVFFGFNDVGTRWVSKLPWTYWRTFTVDTNLWQHDNINLVFDGVDTFATILVNNREVGTTENMFVRYIFNIKPDLTLGENRIEIRFASPVNVANKLYDQQSKDYVVVPVCLPKEYNGECHANHVRKMQASFSWDWGPALPSVGIWKQVYLEAYKSSILRDATVDILSNSKTQEWDIEFRIYLADNFQSSIKGDFLVTLNTDQGEKSVSHTDVTVVKNPNGDLLEKLKLSIPREDVQLWWPNGYGDANLYEVEVRYTSRTEMDTKFFKIGFRTIELVQSAIENGRMFYFKVNGLPIYAKGSNNIPINILPELGQSEDTIRFLLQSAKDVHMNMLRVWGGGNYEADIFYELADEMGILIWQDFMFACAMYPTKPEFLKNVANEVKHQVRRLQHHPSIILWAGNNENEAALRQNWYGTGNDFEQYHSDYIKLYVDTIKNELLLNDETRPYLTSSPTNGIQSEEENFVADNPQSHFYGDVHFYNYQQDSWIRHVYPINRFASEYGYQSLPSINTLLTATDDIEDLKIGSQFLEHRQHLPNGFDSMKLLIDYQLQLPSVDNANYYNAYIYYSQIIQAMAIKIQTEFYRQWRSHTNKKGEGYTMGALYWQLNDVWVAPTWSGIDFKNNWKMLHYFAKEFFAPVIITGDLSITQEQLLEVYIVSDLIKMIDKATVTINVYKWDSFDAVHSETFKTIIMPGASKKVWSNSLEEYLPQISGAPCGAEASRNCFVYLTLKDDQNKTVAPENFVIPAPLKSAFVEKPIIKIQQVEKTGSNNEYTITIESNTIALFVWLETKDIRGRFSENGFLQVTPLKLIQFKPEEFTTVEALTKSLTISYYKQFDTDNGAQSLVRINSSLPITRNGAQKLLQKMQIFALLLQCIFVY